MYWNSIDSINWLFYFRTVTSKQVDQYFVLYQYSIDLCCKYVSQVAEQMCENNRVACSVSNMSFIPFLCILPLFLCLFFFNLCQIAFLLFFLFSIYSQYQSNFNCSISTDFKSQKTTKENQKNARHCCETQKNTCNENCSEAKSHFVRSATHQTSNKNVLLAIFSRSKHTQKNTKLTIRCRRSFRARAFSWRS